MTVSLRRDQRASTVVEFAMVAGIFVPLCLGCLDAGLLLWTKGILQSTAAEAARCAAIGPTACADVKQYAVTLAGNWSFPGIISSTDVATPTLVCKSPTQFSKVTITSAYWASSLISPFGSKTLTAVAYFPTATSC